MDWIYSCSYQCVARFYSFKRENLTKHISESSWLNVKMIHLGQQCHISKILEMPQYLPRETSYLLREMPQLVWGMCISQGEGASLVEDNGIPWRRCSVSRGICGISKILGMCHYSFRECMRINRSIDTFPLPYSVDNYHRCSLVAGKILCIFLYRCMIHCKKYS